MRRTVKGISMRVRTLLSGLTIAGISVAVASGQAPPQPDAGIQAVLDQLTMPSGKPIETLTPQEARKQPTPADAVKALLRKQAESADPEPSARSKIE